MLISLQNADENDSLNMARIEQQKADECALKLLEKHKVCTPFLFLLTLSFLLVLMHAPKADLDYKH